MFNHLTLRSLTRYCLIATISLATVTCASAQTGDAQVNAVGIFANAFKSEMTVWFKKLGLRQPNAPKQVQPVKTITLAAQPASLPKQQQAKAVTDGFAIETRNTTAREIPAILPEQIERYYPGGPEEETVINRGPEYKRAVRISAAFKGFAVQVAKTDLPLLRQDPIFKQFGNIVFDRNESGQYIYLIQTEFTTRQNAEDFVRQVVSKKVANAEVRAY